MAGNLEMVIETVCIGKSSKPSIGLLRVYIDNACPVVVVDDGTPFEAVSTVDVNVSGNAFVLTVELKTPPEQHFRQCSNHVCFLKKRKADDTVVGPVPVKDLWYLYGHSRHIVHDSFNHNKRARTAGGFAQLPASWLEIPFKVCHQVQSGWFKVTLSATEYSVSGDTNAFSNYDRRKLQELVKQPQTTSVRSLTRQEAVTPEWSKAVVEALGRAHAAALKQHPARTRPYYLQGTVDRLDQLISLADRPENRSLVSLNELSNRIRWLERQIAMLPQDSRVWCKYNVRNDMMTFDPAAREIYDFNANPVISDHCLGWHDPISVLARWAFYVRMSYEQIFGLLLWPYIRTRFPEQNPDPGDDHIWLIMAATNCDYFCYFTLLSNFGDVSISEMCERLLADELRLPNMPKLTLDLARPLAWESSSSVAGERASMSPFPLVDVQWEHSSPGPSNVEDLSFFSPEVV